MEKSCGRKDLLWLSSVNVVTQDYDRLEDTRSFILKESAKSHKFSRAQRVDSETFEAISPCLFACLLMLTNRKDPLFKYGCKVDPFEVDVRYYCKKNDLVVVGITKRQELLFL